jgi:hypothetical protein
VRQSNQCFFGLCSAFALDSLPLSAFIRRSGVAATRLYAVLSAVKNSLVFALDSRQFVKFA